MTLSSRFVASGLSVASILLLSAATLVAQESPASSTSAKPEAPSTKPAGTAPRRVPNYFGQLGLSREQKDSVYAVMAKHQARIEQLKKELAEANHKMVEECESLLDETQRKALEARRSSAADASKARAAVKAARAKDDKKSD